MQAQNMRNVSLEMFGKTRKRNDLQAQQIQQAEQTQQAQFLLIQQQNSVMFEILKSVNHIQ